jgi:hypothetical protein
MSAPAKFTSLATTTGCLGVSPFGGHVSDQRIVRYQKIN